MASAMPAVLLAAYGETGGAQNNALLARVAAEVVAQLLDLPAACGVLSGVPAPVISMMAESRAEQWTGQRQPN